MRTLVKKLENVDSLQINRKQKLAFWIIVHYGLVMHLSLCLSTVQSTLQEYDTSYFVMMIIYTFLVLFSNCMNFLLLFCNCMNDKNCKSLSQISYFLSWFWVAICEHEHIQTLISPCQVLHHWHFIVFNFHFWDRFSDMKPKKLYKDETYE